MVQQKTFKLYIKRSPWWKRYDVWPFFFVLYPALGAMLARQRFSGYIPTRILAATAVTVIVHVLLHLSTFWSTRWRSRLLFSPTSSPEMATHVLVASQKPGRRAELCPIVNQKEALSIDYLKKRYRWPLGDHSAKLIGDTAKQEKGSTTGFASLGFPTTHPLRYYLEERQGLSSGEAAELQEIFGTNQLEISLPTFSELFKEHARAPFFVFQIFCVGLWLLDEYWMHSLMTLVLLMFLEAQIVFKRLRELKNLQNVRFKAFPIQVLRDKKWIFCSSDDLVPGDIVAIPPKGPHYDFMCPCDMLLLYGSVVTNEAVLTGESVPQTKVALTADAELNECLDLRQKHRQHVLFAGTTVVTTAQSDTMPPPFKKCPHQHCFGYVLRTGFHTSQGKVVRSILYTADRVTGENSEALWFLLVLLVCACIASGYVLRMNWEAARTGKRSRHKLLLNCVMIITSVVPPEFPITMSMAVTLSLVELVRRNVFCTEPFRLPYAGKVSICAFDKTGTLTSDSMRVLTVLGTSATGSEPLPVVLRNSSQRGDLPVENTLRTAQQQQEVLPLQLPRATVAVLAGCHSVAPIGEGQLAGDPVDKAAIASVGWTVKTMDRVVSSNLKTGMETLTIVRRFPFSSHLQRMTVVAQHSGPALTSDSDRDPIFTDRTGVYVLSKGSPEVMKPFLREVPETYDVLYQETSNLGYRVLCLASKRLGTLSGNYASLPREELEKDLEFAGFVVIGCPIKPSTTLSLAKLTTAQHKLIMITGDNPLTACQVALDTQLVSGTSVDGSQKNDDPFLVLDDVLYRQHTLPQLCWKSRDKLTTRLTASVDELRSLRGFFLCVPGSSLAALKAYPTILSTLIRSAVIFARVSPQQKEEIVAELVASGEVVVMCGDGTNDVGALKAAHIGVSLLNCCTDHEKKKRHHPSMQKKKHETFQQRLERLRDEDDIDTTPQLGTASIASPFTYKGDTIQCIPPILRLGRATLATVMTMYKTMAITSLVTAFSLSVLTLDGVKFGDAQATVENIFVSFLVFVASRATPAKKLSVERPVEAMFSLSVLVSILGQSLIHLSCLIAAWLQACSYRPPDYQQDIDGDFSPNIVNTVVFLLLSAMHGSAFLANYEGHPFLIRFRHNTLLWKGLLVFYGTLTLLALELLPDLNAMASLVPFPDAQLKYNIFGLMVVDVVASWILGRACCRWGVHRRNRLSTCLNNSERSIK